MGDALQDCSQQLHQMLAAADTWQGVNIEDVLDVAYDLGTTAERGAGAGTFATCCTLLQRLATHPAFQAEWPNVLRELINQAGHRDEYAGFYRLCAVLRLRSAIDFLAELTGARLDTDELDERLIYSAGDSVDFPDALPLRVPPTHWWWTFAATSTEALRRGLPPTS